MAQQILMNTVWLRSGPRSFEDEVSRRRGFWQAHVAKFDVARDSKHLGQGSSSGRRHLGSVIFSLLPSKDNARIAG